MQINDVIKDPKASLAYAKRRGTAIAGHGRTVLKTGLHAAEHVADVAVQNLKSSLELQKDTLLDSGMPITQRVRRLRRNAIEAVATARDEITQAVKEGYASVTERASHVTDVTHKEQAIENKLGRKAKKLKKAAAAAAHDITT